MKQDVPHTLLRSILRRLRPDLSFQEIRRMERKDMIAALHGSVEGPPQELTWDNAPQTLSITQARKLLEISSATAARWLKKGVFPAAYRVGSSWRVDFGRLRQARGEVSLRRNTS